MFVVGFVAEARLDSVFLASSVVLTQQQIQMVGATVRDIIFKKKYYLNIT